MSAVEIEYCFPAVSMHRTASTLSIPPTKAHKIVRKYQASLKRIRESLKRNRQNYGMLLSASMAIPTVPD